MLIQNIWKSIARIGAILADLRILFFALFWLMFLLAAGTVAQRYIGLFEAQRRFFSSFFLWLGPVPLPGGYLTMAVVFVGLLAVLLFKRPRWRTHGGVIVAHIGALLLLFGGFVTAAFSREGHITLAEGETVDYATDRHGMEFAVIDESAADHDTVTAFARGWLKEGRILRSPALPFRLRIRKYYRNCRALRRNSPAGREYRGLARHFALAEAPLQTEERLNRAGVEFRIEGAGRGAGGADGTNDAGVADGADGTNDAEGANGIRIVLESMPAGPVVRIGGGAYRLRLRRARMRLPFALYLVDFEKKTHPGTGLARSYTSVVRIIDGDIQQRAVIRMNEPLRYRGHTFFQSSYAEGGGREISVLAVVRNIGRLFPYISSLIMCAGLLIHLLLKTPKLMRGRK